MTTHGRDPPATTPHLWTMASVGVLVRPEGNVVVLSSDDFGSLLDFYPQHEQVKGTECRAIVVPTRCRPDQR
jgi:hypothetical protein